MRNARSFEPESCLGGDVMFLVSGVLREIEVGIAKVFILILNDSAESVPFKMEMMHAQGNSQPK
jgi:hypothetical protein